MRRRGRFRGEIDLMYLPTCTPRHGGVAHVFEGVLTVFPCGSRTAFLGVTMSLAFMNASGVRPIGPGNLR